MCSSFVSKIQIHAQISLAEDESHGKHVVQLAEVKPDFLMPVKEDGAVICEIWQQPPEYHCHFQFCFWETVCYCNGF